MKPSLHVLAKHWWPVLFWLGVIRLESTETASATNTSKIVYVVVATVYPSVQPSFIEQLNAVLRKSGHFLGYGILGALVFLALRNTNREMLRELGRSWGACLRDFWRWQWAVFGILVTLLTAALDEIHQTSLPSRTGSWHDVVLDTCGAVVLQIILYFLSLRAFNRRERARQPEPVVSSR